MSLRQGSAEAREFLRSNDTSCWLAMLQNYGKIIHAMDSLKKSPPSLSELDTFWMIEYPEIVKSKDVKSFSLSELSNIMKWKLARGKARPLQKLVDSNDPKTVVKVSTDAFQILDISSSNWSKAMDILCQLKGIGEATASAILAPIYPELCPFMADEVIEATTDFGRKYDRKTYLSLRPVLISKAEQLNKLQTNHHWTAEDVGKAIWVRAKMTIFFPSQPINPEDFSADIPCQEKTLDNASTNSEFSQTCIPTNSVKESKKRELVISSSSSANDKVVEKENSQQKISKKDHS